MKTKTTKFLSVSAVVLAAASLLAVGARRALASGSSPSSLAAGVAVPDRKNNAVSAGAPLSNSAKGSKVFGADTAATLAVDEKGNAYTEGAVAGLDVASKDGVPRTCYLMVFDSAVAADTTEAGSVSRMLVPPVLAVTSGNAIHEFIYPPQFHKGLVVLLGGADAASCRASVRVLKNGGTN